jgi:hypothetical protein
MAQNTLLTTVGKNYTATKMADTTTTTVVPKWIGIGTGVHVAALTDTILTTEVETRSGTNPATSSTNVFSVIQTIQATALRAVTEAGLFSAVSGGTMMISSTFDVINLQINDSIQITATITYG